MYHLTEAYLMASYICLLAIYLGALVFGTAVVAPVATTALDEPHRRCSFFASLLGGIPPFCRARRPLFHGYCRAWLHGFSASRALCLSAGLSSGPDDHLLLLGHVPYQPD